MKIKLTFENRINCLEPTQFENKVNHLDNSKIVIGSLKKGRKNHKKKTKKLTLKHSKDLGVNKGHIFDAEINKIA